MRGIKWDLPLPLYSPDDPEFKEWSRGFEKITEEQQKLLTGDKRLVIIPSTPYRSSGVSTAALYFYNQWVQNEKANETKSTDKADSSGKNKD